VPVVDVDVDVVFVLVAPPTPSVVPALVLEVVVVVELATSPVLTDPAVAVVVPPPVVALDVAATFMEPVPLVVELAALVELMAPLTVAAVDSLVVPALPTGLPFDAASSLPHAANTRAVKAQTKVLRNIGGLFQCGSGDRCGPGKLRSTRWPRKHMWQHEQTLAAKP